MRKNFTVKSHLSENWLVLRVQILNRGDVSSTWLKLKVGKRKQENHVAIKVNCCLGKK